MTTLLGATTLPDGSCMSARLVSGGASQHGIQFEYMGPEHLTRDAHFVQFLWTEIVVHGDGGHVSMRGTRATTGQNWPELTTDAAHPRWDLDQFRGAGHSHPWYPFEDRAPGAVWMSDSPAMNPDGTAWPLDGIAAAVARHPEQTGHLGAVRRVDLIDHFDTYVVRSGSGVGQVVAHVPWTSQITLSPGAGETAGPEYRLGALPAETDALPLAQWAAMHREFPADALTVPHEPVHAADLTHVPGAAPGHPYPDGPPVPAHPDKARAAPWDQVTDDGTINPPPDPQHTDDPGHALSSDGKFLSDTVVAADWHDKVGHGPDPGKQPLDAHHPMGHKDHSDPSAKTPLQPGATAMDLSADPAGPAPHLLDLPGGPVSPSQQDYPATTTDPAPGDDPDHHDAHPAGVNKHAATDHDTHGKGEAPVSPSMSPYPAPPDTDHAAGAANDPGSQDDHGD